MGAYSGSNVITRKRFGYGGKTRDIGEVFKLLGLRNDDRLYGLDKKGGPKPGRYVDLFKGSVDNLPKCPECGAIFATDSRREQHYRLRHEGVNNVY